VSADPKCPFCGFDLEGFVDPNEAEAQATFVFAELRRANEIADLLEYELEGSSTPNPDVLREWRLRHPKRPDRPQTGDNPGDNPREPMKESE
jgi:hypothetical protein